MRRPPTKRELLASTLETGERPKLDRYIHLRFNGGKDLTTGIVFYLEGKTDEGRKVRARLGDRNFVIDLYSAIRNVYSHAKTVGLYKEHPDPSQVLPPLERRMRMRFTVDKGVDTGLTFYMGRQEGSEQVVHAVLPDSDMTRGLWCDLNMVFDECSIVHEMPSGKARKKK